MPVLMEVYIYALYKRNHRLHNSNCLVPTIWIYYWTFVVVMWKRADKNWDYFFCYGIIFCGTELLINLMNLIN